MAKKQNPSVEPVDVLGELGKTLGQLNKLSKDYTDAVKKEIDSYRARISAIAGFVGLVSPGTVYRFQLALRDLGATVGRILVPVLEHATRIIRTVADAIMSLPPGLRDFLGVAGKVLITIGAIALVFKTVTLVMGLAVAASNLLTTALTAQAAASTAAAVAGGGLLTMLTRLGGLALGIGGGTALGTALGGDAATSALGSTIGTAIGGALGSFFGPLGTFIGMGLGGLLGGGGAGLASKDKTSSVGAAVGPSRVTTGDELYRAAATAALMAEGPGSEAEWRRGMLDALRQLVAQTRGEPMSDISDRSRRLLTGGA